LAGFNQKAGDGLFVQKFSTQLPDHKGKGKGKVHPRTGHEDPRGGVEV
jgi:hypothetical protein